MKKGLIIGLVLGVAVSLVSFMVIPAFAQDGKDSQRDTAWEEMHDACVSGDWNAMIDAAKRFHGDNFDSLPCHQGWSDNTTPGGRTPKPAQSPRRSGGGGGRGVGGGMMGGGWGGMMGGGWW